MAPIKTRTKVDVCASCHKPISETARVCVIEFENYHEECLMFEDSFPPKPISKEEIKFFMLKRGLTITDVIDCAIEINGIIGVGLITLGEQLETYIKGKMLKQTTVISQDVPGIINLITDYVNRHVHNPHKTNKTKMPTHVVRIILKYGFNMPNATIKLLTGGGSQSNIMWSVHLVRQMYSVDLQFKQQMKELCLILNISPSIFEEK